MFRTHYCMKWSHWLFCLSVAYTGTRDHVTPPAARGLQFLPSLTIVILTKVNGICNLTTSGKLHIPWHVLPWLAGVLQGLKQEAFLALSVHVTD